MERDMKPNHTLDGHPAWDAGMASGKFDFTFHTVNGEFVADIFGGRDMSGRILKRVKGKAAKGLARHFGLTLANGGHAVPFDTPRLDPRYVVGGLELLVEKEAA
jgi:hypothetical protein